MNKGLERIIAETVYPGAIGTLRPREAPDFVLEREGKACLGVEVTELFPDESQARLGRIPNYAVHLLSGGSVRHKDDRNLRIEKVTYKSGQTGQSCEINAIIHTVPSPDEALTNLRRAIRQKDAKHTRYAESVKACDLIVHDACRTLRFESASSLLQSVGRHPIRKDLLRSRFRDIIVCTPTDNEKSLFIPLKASLFASDVFAFRRLIAESEPREADTPKARFASMCRALLARGFEGAKAWLDGQSIVLRYASVDVARKHGPLACADNTGSAEGAHAEPLSHLCDDDDKVRALTAELLRRQRKETWYVALAA